MPWVPEVFSAPVLQQILDRRRRGEMVAVSYFDGLLSGELDALIESFAGEPELHDPVRGRIRGVEAFTAFVAETRAWLAQDHVSVEDVGHVILEKGGFEEVVLHGHPATGPVDLPVAVVADGTSDNRLAETRVYSSNWPLTGRRVVRPPLPGRSGPAAPGRGGDLANALADGDVAAARVHLRDEGLCPATLRAASTCTPAWTRRRLHAQQFSTGGIEMEHCALDDDGRTCALEYNAVRWGETDRSAGRSRGLRPWRRPPGGGADLRRRRSPAAGDLRR